MLIGFLALAMATNASQGQMLAIDSLDTSTVHDSARIGSLVYRAATTLTYPKRDPGKPGDVEGDLTTVVSIRNTGLGQGEMRLNRCPLRTYAFLRPDYKLFRGIPRFPSTIACMAGEHKIRLGAGTTKNVVLISRHWKHGNQILGPMNFVAELQLPDTSVRLAAGKSATTNSLAGLEYHATTKLEGFAPSKIVGTVMISNHGELPAMFDYGACAVKLFAFRSAAKAGAPAWVSNPEDMCIAILYQRMLAPGYSTSIEAVIPTHDMMKEPIQAGRYFFTAQIELNNQKFTMDAGAVTISGTDDPLPVSRTVDSISFSSSIKRISYGSGIRDSLEVMFISRNQSHMTRTIRPASRCIDILGYRNRERRNSYYSRPAYERDWTERPCPMPAMPFEVVPGRVHISFKRIAAPAEPMFYTIYLEFFDDTFPTRDSYFVDLAADEGAYP